MTGKIFSKWDETHSELVEPPADPARTRDAQVAGVLDGRPRQLIESYPREHYSLVKTGANGSSRVWREGDIGSLSGRQVIDAISRGGLWLNMRNVGLSISRYRKLIDRMFEEIEAKVPDFAMPKPPGRHPDLLAGRAGLLSRRSAGPGPDPDRRPQAGLRLSEHRAVHHAATPRGHRAVRRRGRSALRVLVRRAREGVRSRTRPDAELAAERAAPRRESSTPSTSR